MMFGKNGLFFLSEHQAVGGGSDHGGSPVLKFVMGLMSNICGGLPEVPEKLQNAGLLCC